MREYLASYFVVDYEGMDRAVELAARYPTARKHGVEVGPVMDDTGQEMRAR